MDAEQEAAAAAPVPMTITREELSLLVSHQASKLATLSENPPGKKRKRLFDEALVSIYQEIDLIIIDKKASIERQQATLAKAFALCLLGEAHLKDCGEKGLELRHQFEAKNEVLQNTAKTNLDFELAPFLLTLIKGTKLTLSWRKQQLPEDPTGYFAKYQDTLDLLLDGLSHASNKNIIFDLLHQCWSDIQFVATEMLEQHASFSLNIRSSWILLLGSCSDYRCDFSDPRQQAVIATFVDTQKMLTTQLLHSPKEKKISLNIQQFLRQRFNNLTNQLTQQILSGQMIEGFFSVAKKQPPAQQNTASPLLPPPYQKKKKKPAKEGKPEMSEAEKAAAEKAAEKAMAALLAEEDHCNKQKTRNPSKTSAEKIREEKEATFRKELFNTHPYLDFSVSKSAEQKYANELMQLELKKKPTANDAEKITVLRAHLQAYNEKGQETAILKTLNQLQEKHPLLIDNPLLRELAELTCPATGKLTDAQAKNSPELQKLRNKIDTENKKITSKKAATVLDTAKKRVAEFDTANAREAAAKAAKKTDEAANRKQPALTSEKEKRKNKQPLRKKQQASTAHTSAGTAAIALKETVAQSSPPSANSHPPKPTSAVIVNTKKAEPPPPPKLPRETIEAPTATEAALISANGHLEKLAITMSTEKLKQAQSLLDEGNDFYHKGIFPGANSRYTTVKNSTHDSANAGQHEAQTLYLYALAKLTMMTCGSAGFHAQKTADAGGKIASWLTTFNFMLKHWEEYEKIATHCSETDNSKTEMKTHTSAFLTAFNQFRAPLAHLVEIQEKQKEVDQLIAQLSAKL